MLHENCLCPLGQQLVDGMTWSTDFERIQKEVRRTMEFVGALQAEDFPSVGFFDLRPSVKRLRIQNTSIEVEELFNLQRALTAILDIAGILDRRQDGENGCAVYPALSELAGGVPTYPQLVRRIGQVVDIYGHVKDTASPQLCDIRRQLAATAGSVSRILQRVARMAKDEGLTDKEAQPTLRDGRLVLPVQPAMRRKIRGIVHDESDSGKTIYVEPAEAVEANNKIRELESEERKEIKRILMEISNLIRPDIEGMLQSFEFLAQVDFLRSKALLAIATRSVQPRMENRRVVDWSMAVHPLLYLKYKERNAVHPDEPSREVVPLDIELNSRKRVLLISGPNAGGKSVCLKTVGLLQYMYQCGMPVSMSSDSVVGVFDSIFIDIGDEQSIDNDLSTYSSHLINMKNMMRHSDEGSLILIDEFGGGTEPQFGGAMAEAMLRVYDRKQVFGVITTHYQNLKHFAQESHHIANGAMLYDRQQMSPLFQLSIGTPGSSFAIDIARKSGIPDEVIRNASEIVGEGYINSDKYLQDIARDKRYWEQKRQLIHQREKQMEQTIQQYEDEIKRLRGERRAIISEAKEEADRLLTDANAVIERTIREIKEAQAEKERTLTIRRNYADFKKEVREKQDEETSRLVAKEMERILARRKRKAEKRENGGEATPAPGVSSGRNARPVSGMAPSVPMDAGSFVRLKGQDTVGQIRKVNGNEALVVFGSLSTNVKISRLEPAEAPKEKSRTAATFISVHTQDEIRNMTLQFKGNIDVRGQRSDEAIQSVTMFLDEACVARASRVSILHGTGTGSLKTSIRQFLSTYPAVSDFHDEDIRFGGAGITIVELE